MPGTIFSGLGKVDLCPNPLCFYTVGEVRPGIYQHYKGKQYRVIGVARHSENPEELFVVYQALYDSKDFGNNAVWVRPLAMFLENAPIDGKLVPRFRLIEKQ